MGPIAAPHPRRNGLPSASRLVDEEAESVVSPVKWQEALLTLGIATLSFLTVWLAETASGAIAPHDRWAEPAMVAVMGSLFVALLLNPSRRLFTQRVAVGALMAYFACNTTAVVLTAGHNSRPDAHVYTLVSPMLWLPTLFLMLFATWRVRWALTGALLLLGSVVMPVLVAIASGFDPNHSALGNTWLLLLNALMAQALLLIGLVALARLHQRLRDQVRATPAASAPDNRQTIEGWVEQRTADLARAKEAAEAASRAKSRFLAVMSHELRTPLHAVLASAELLRDSRNGAQEVIDSLRDAALVETIRRSGAHLLTLIDEVLELSRIEAGKLELAAQPFDLRDVAEQAMQAVRQQAYDKGLKLSCQLIQPLAVHRRGDALRVTQVLINLLANAVKFTDKGEVELRVESGADASSEQVRFIIRDTGPGLSADQQARVFDAFHQVDSRSTRQHGGAGLGLTITRELVHLMTGKLSLQSEPGQGTQIEVDLPLQLAPAPPVTLPPPSVPRSVSSADSLQGTTVLVVEDDPVNSMLATEMLAGAGATVEAVESGPAALAWLRAFGADIVLMDWRMPGMDGLEVTRRIRQGQAGTAAQQLPIIGLTANAFAEDRDACLEAGMNHVLTKPIDRRRLIQDVQQFARAPGCHTTTG